MPTTSKRLRFEVLRRDNYACRYCGRGAPEVKLTVDAVVPEALGGSHKDPANLVAACGDCNGGKSATPPDAPLVADVAQDAIRWSQAIKAASTRMLADLEARRADREQFRQWWDDWTYGDGDARQRVPRDAGWEQSVDQFVAAGLPMAVLKDCIALTMTRTRIAHPHKFRYMCGIAWSKVTELQKAAQAVAGDEVPDADHAVKGDACERGRRDLARELLAQLGDDEREHYLDQADMSEYQDEDEPPQTETELVSEAISQALNSVRSNWDYLARCTEDMLRNLPDQIGERALAPREDPLDKLTGPCGRRTFHLTDALRIADDLLNLPAARERLNAVTDAERTEWLAYAAAVWHRADLDEDRLTSRAGHLITAIADGYRWDGMCIGRGDVILVCPRRGTNYARIADADCCGSDGPADHKGHLVCDLHLEQLIEGTYIGGSGKTFSATDYAAVGSDPWDF